MTAPAPIPEVCRYRCRTCEDLTGLHPIDDRRDPIGGAAVCWCCGGTETDIVTPRMTLPTECRK